MVRVALDGMALHRQGRGVARVLQNVLPLLTRDPRLDCVILSTEEGREFLDLPSAEFHVAPPMIHSAWEQLGLPWHARESGPMLSIALPSADLHGDLLFCSTLLRTPSFDGMAPKRRTSRERVRRVYQRLTIRRGLHHASFLATCSPACRSALKNRFGPRLGGIESYLLALILNYSIPISPVAEARASFT